MKRNEQELIDELKKRYEALKNQRQKYESIWQTLSELVLPRIADITFDGTRTDSVSYKVEGAYDSTGRSALRLAVDGTYGHLTPRTSTFFKLAPVRRAYGKLSPRGKKALQEAEYAVLDELQRSNFYDSMTPVYEHGFSIGTSPMHIMEDVQRKTIVYTPKHPKAYYAAENAYGIVDTIFESQWMTWRQVAQQFGAEKLTLAMQQSLKDTPYEEVEVLRCVTPRSDRDPKKKDNLNMPYRVVWMFADEDVILRESGYQFMHDIFWRFRAMQGDVYGTSPAWDAYLDLKRADKFAETLLRAADLAVRPPVQGPGKLLRSDQLRPAGMIPTHDGLGKIEPINLVGNYPIGKDQTEALEHAIRQHFMVDYYMMLYQTAERQRTAYETAQLAGEKAAVMQAMVGRIESELLDPTLQATVAIMSEAGRFPDMPDELLDPEAGGGLKFDYISPLAEMQRQHHGRQTVANLIADIMPILQINPQAADNINWDGLLRNTAEDSYLDVLLDERMVAQIREARAQQQAAMNQVATVKEMSEAAENLKEPGAQQAFGALQQMGGR